jgi:hypothetical protein
LLLFAAGGYGVIPRLVGSLRIAAFSYFWRTSPMSEILRLRRGSFNGIRIAFKAGVAAEFCAWKAYSSLICRHIKGIAGAGCHLRCVTPCINSCYILWLKGGNGVLALLPCIPGTNLYKSPRLHSSLLTA